MRKNINSKASKVLDTEFLLPQRISAFQKIRCIILNEFENLSEKLGSSCQFPGHEMLEQRAFLQFRNFKDIFDLTVNSSSGYRTLSSRTIAIDYFQYMLPGVKFEIGATKDYRPVDPEHVLGCSWQNYSVPSNPLEIISKLNAAPPGGINRAIYIQVEDLPIFIADEGQNRVELFRRHKHKINADIRKLVVTRRPLIQRNALGDKWLSTWPNRFGTLILVALPFPSISLPMYRALGVELKTTRLPVNETDVQRSIDRTIERMADSVGLP